MHMPHRAVAAHAGNSLTALRRMRAVDRLRDFGVTLQASLFGDRQIAFADLNGFVKAARGEVKRMPKSVGGFGGVFPHQARRRVAIVAGGDRAMRRLQPAVVLLVHNVAIGARSRIVGQIGVALGVHERVGADPNCDPNQASHNDVSQGAEFHVLSIPVSKICIEIKLPLPSKLVQMLSHNDFAQTCELLIGAEVWK